MSLFKAREFWVTECSSEEQFGLNSLTIAKINNSDDYIITGSYSGLLRIFKPSSELEENILSGYKPADLLIEKKFSEPILQTAVGRLTSGSQFEQIAVLHPRSVAVYSLTIKQGATEHGTQNILTLLYEHKLRRSANNFVLGPFGGSQNRDFICVQSLDGLLTFLEQESFAFCCFLPNFLLPAPFVFSKKTDSFITVSSNWCIESVRYKRISEIGENSSEDDTIGKKVEPDWSYNLGEGVLDLQYIQNLYNKESVVAILGERNLYCLYDNGNLKFMKRLEYSPVCFFNYILEYEHDITTMVVAETNTVLIYRNTTLKWSAQLSFLPVAISRAFFKNIKGALVALSEEGKIHCCYLGTEPSLFTAPPLTNQELNYEEIEAELTTLNKIIRNQHTNDTKLMNASVERELQVKISVDPHLKPCAYDSKLHSQFPDLEIVMCLLTIDLVPQVQFEEVQVSVFVQPSFKCSQSTEFFNNLNERTKFECNIFLDDVMIVSSLQAEITISYVSSLGVPRVINKTIMLPIQLLLETCPSIKESEHKLTLNINNKSVPLSTLFPEYMGENTLTQASNAIGFKCINGSGDVVSILSAKSSQRYRLQSDSFLSLSIIVQQMTERLKNHFNNVVEFSITYTSSLPTTPVLEYVRNHFATRQTVNVLQKELIQLSAQYRVIQKRLMTKLKDKNPTPLTNLEMLLQSTYVDIINVADKIVEENANFSAVQNELSCALNLILQLMSLMNVNEDVLEYVVATFSSLIYDLEEQNWEDTMDAALCYLLRTVLAKGEKDKLRTTHTSFEEIKEISKLEKHMTQVLERFSKGGPTLEIDEETIHNEPLVKEDIKAVGSRLGESSSRVLSARKNLFRRKVIEEAVEPSFDQFETV